MKIELKKKYICCLDARGKKVRACFVFEYPWIRGCDPHKCCIIRVHLFTKLASDNGGNALGSQNGESVLSSHRQNIGWCVFW